MPWSGVLCVSQGQKSAPQEHQPCSALAKSSAALSVSSALGPVPEDSFFSLWDPPTLPTGLRGVWGQRVRDASLLLLKVPAGAGGSTENSKNKRDKRLRVC